MLVDHIAVLVTDLEQTVSKLPDHCTIHPAEFQEGEGTRERYVAFREPGTPSLLLIEAVSPGPYSRALKKRGAGLHHIGCRCIDIMDTVTSAEANLLLHPISLKTMEYGVVWICRAGMPFLIELMEGDGAVSNSNRCTGIELPSGIDLPEYVSSLFRNLRLTEGKTDSMKIKVADLELSLFPGMKKNSAER